MRRSEFLRPLNNIPQRLVLASAGVIKGGLYGPQKLFHLADGRSLYLDLEVAQRIEQTVTIGQEFWLCKRKAPRRGQKTRWDIYLDDPTPQDGESGLERDLRLSIERAKQNRRDNVIELETPASESSAPETPAPEISALETSASEKPLPETPATETPVRETPALEIPAPETSAAKPAENAGPVPVLGPQPAALPEVIKKVPSWSVTLVNQTNELIDAYAECLRHSTQHGFVMKSEDVRTLLVTTFINLCQRNGRKGAA